MKHIFANNIKFFLMLSIFLLTGINALAATRVVTKLADTNDGVCNNDCSLREAIAAAANGDKIYFQAALSGTITLNILNGSLLIGKNITINGSDHVSVSGGGGDLPKLRVFVIKGGATVTMNNMEIKNGEGEILDPDIETHFGAGIYVNNSTLYLNDSYIHHNEAHNGGGIAVRNSGILKVKNTQIDSNTARVGGGILCVQSTLEITDSLITKNQSNGSAGGVGASSCNLTMTNTTVSQNTSKVDNTFMGYGGGLSLQGSDGLYKITNSSIIYNQGNTGGGIYNEGKLYLINSTVSGNGVLSNGGGVYNKGKTIVRNSTITLNYALNSGSGFGVEDGSNVYISNSIIAGNKNPQNGSPDIKGTVYSFGYNIIGSTNGANILGFSFGNKLNINPLLAPLANNGGPTPTHIPNPGSPAINAGSNGLAVDANAQPLTFDQRGYARINGGTVDIGAVEIQNQVSSLVSVSGKVTDTLGQPVSNARVKITNMATGKSKTVRLSVFSDFLFDEVEAGQTYLVEVLHKSFVFVPQAITVNEGIDGLSFIGGNRN